MDTELNQKNDVNHERLMSLLIDAHYRIPQKSPFLRILDKNNIRVNKNAYKQMMSIVISSYTSYCMTDQETNYDFTDMTIAMYEFYSSHGLSASDTIKLIESKHKDWNNIKIQEYLRNRAPTFHELSLRAIVANKIDVSKLPEVMVTPS